MARAMTIDDLYALKRVSDPQISPDGTSVAFVVSVPNRDEDRDDTRIWVVPAEGGDARPLTNGPRDGLPRWSPDGTRLAFVRKPDDGKPQVFVLPIGGGEPEQSTDLTGGVGDVRWAPDGRRLAVVATVDLAGDDEPKVQPPVHIARLRYKNDGAGLARTKRRHLFVVDADDVTQITQGDFDVNQPCWSPDGSRIAFSSAMHPARDRGCVHIYEAPIGGQPRKVVGGDDLLASQVTASADGSRIAYVVSTPSIPGDVYVDDRRLTSMNSDLFDDLELREPDPRTFSAPDGGEVPGWLIPGAGDGPRPLLVDVHGGPHNAWGPNFGSNARFYHQILAAQGWSILLVNPRGSDGYGEAFFSSLTAGWGVVDMQDFMAAVDSLIDSKEADPDRLAVTGNSYGGYMTTWIIGHTDRFAAAVSTGNVTNLKSMYGTSDLGAFLGWEIGGEPHTHVEHFRELSPLTYAQDVTTPTLLVHGLRDDRCPVGQTEEFFSAMRLAGKAPVEMVLYPEASHLFMAQGPPSYRVDYCRRLIDWITHHTSNG